MTEDQQPGTGFDRLLGFSLPARHARGRAVRLGPVLHQILAAHDYPPAIKHLLSEALVLTALVGGLLKGEGSQLTIQAQAPGAIVELLVCDFLDGALRGYAKHDAARIDEVGVAPSLQTLFGEGSLTITFDMASSGQRYQGVVPLEGRSLTAALERYFARSEQVPTLIKAAVADSTSGLIAGGILVQHLPEGEDGRERLHARDDHPEWEHVAVLASTMEARELTDPALALETLVWRLFYEERELRSDAGTQLSRGCRCSIEHFEDVLARFSKQDRRDMRNEQGVILVDCAFCSREFSILD